MPKSNSKKHSTLVASNTRRRHDPSLSAPAHDSIPKASKQDQYLQKKIKELNSLDSKLSTLKKGVAAFCLFIILLNVYHIKRLGTVSTDLSGLVNKYNDTVSRMDNIKKRQKKSYISFLDRNRSFMKLRPDIKDPSPEVEQYMDDPLFNMKRSDIEKHRRILNDRLTNSEEDITAYIMPFEIMMGDYDGNKFEQSKFDCPHVFVKINCLRLEFCCARPPQRAHGSKWRHDDV